MLSGRQTMLRRLIRSKKQSMDIAIEFLCILLSLPLRIVLFVLHVYLLNVVGLLQLYRLLLKMLMELLASAERHLRSSNHSRNRIEYRVRLLGPMLRHFQMLIILQLVLLGQQTRIMLSFSRLLRHWSKTRTWIIKR
ncbi:uncharacterized protein LOC117791489 [Drosophila innubila]|uniref:uncharacterized protein LOC117791489 n=1 Tax=Drosophila innubila TaxID=198719 RepID=UPI00148D796E|nr:uncharacterized protein LOC117791489 [Drosophila innubila]